MMKVVGEYGEKRIFNKNRKLFLGLVTKKSKMICKVARMNDFWSYLILRQQGLECVEWF